MRTAISVAVRHSKYKNSLRFVRGIGPCAKRNETKRNETKRNETVVLIKSESSRACLGKETV
jgi:hypothetical protein